MAVVQNILFPVDFSPSCFAIAAYVKRVAALFSAKVSVLHVLKPAAYNGFTTAAALLQQTLTAGANGNFAFNQIPPGTYFVTVHAKGFPPYTSTTFTLAAWGLCLAATVLLGSSTARTN